MKKKVIVWLMTILMAAGSLTGLKMESKASSASFTVVGEVANSANEQVFTVYNYGDGATFDCYNGGSLIVSLPIGAGGAASFSVGTSDRIQVQVMNADTGEVIGATSRNEYVYNVYRTVNGGGQEWIGSSTVSMANGMSSYSVASTIGSGASTYVTDEPTKYLSYGENSLTFKYYTYQYPDRYVTISYVDERGNALPGGYNDTINVSDAPTYTVPAQLSHNGKTYNKANGMPTAISLDYNSPTLSYTIVYEAEAQAPSSPYSVRIIYKDAASGAVIGSSSMVIPVNGTGSFNIPSTITTPDHVDYILAAGQPAQIQHAANNSTRTYEVYYNVSSVKNPYTVSISLVDIATGAVIGSETLDVAVGGAVDYEVPSTVQFGNDKYYLASGQSNAMRHVSGDATRRYNYYYNKEGSEEVSRYDVTVKYIDVTDNSELYTSTATANAGDILNISVPGEYSADGSEYVLLSGQTDIEHPFYSPRRTYAIYFRDVNDTTTEENVVTEDIIETITETPVQQLVTTITNPETEEETNLNEQGQPVEINENNELVPIEDEPVPLAEGPATEQSKETITITDEEVPMANQDLSSNPTGLIIGGSILGLLVLAGIILLILKKRKQENI